MLWLYRYLCGYLKIIIKGDNGEKILNICAVNSIILFNSRLVKKDIETCILIKDFKKLKKLMRGSKTRIHICEKHGLPFKIQKHRNRSGLFLGIFLIFIIIQFMSSYIWVIDVVGNSVVSKTEIINSLKKIGITEGIKSTHINPKTQREQLLLECEGLAWASLNIEGSILTVNVTEINETKPSTTPTNLKASADGIIEKIDVTSGNCVVKVGDTVKKGDLLVSGINETLHSTTFVKSLGSIYAETTREYKLTKKFKQTITYKTGESKTKKVLDVFTLKFPLYLGKETRDYTSSTKCKNIKLFKKTLPIKIYTREFEYIEKENITFAKEELYNQLEKELKKATKKDNISKYTVSSKEYVETKEDITLKVIVKAKENIAFSEQILF